MYIKKIEKTEQWYTHVVAHLYTCICSKTYIWLFLLLLYFQSFNAMWSSVFVMINLFTQNVCAGLTPPPHTTFLNIKFTTKNEYISGSDYKKIGNIYTYAYTIILMHGECIHVIQTYIICTCILITVTRL